MPADIQRFLELLERDDEDEAVACCLELTEADRSRIAKVTKSALAAHVAEVGSTSARTIALGVLDVADVARVVGNWLPPRDVALRLLRHRSRRFRDAWVSSVCDGGAWSPFAVAFELIATGDASEPPAEPFTLSMIFGTARCASEDWRQQAIAPVLRQQPLLLESVWSLFEYEGGGEVSLAAHDKYTTDEKSWKHALVELSNEGLLDRQRLLDASLESLERDFGAFRASWFAAFHEALTPTVDERAGRAANYVRLLGSPVTATVSLARTAVGALDKAKRLDAGLLVNGLPPGLLTSTSKTTAVKLLSLVTAAAKRDPALVGPAASRLVDALANESSDVQAKAVGHLRSMMPVPSPEIRASVAGLATSAHASIRPALSSWTGEEGEPDRAAGPEPSAPSPPLGELFARIAALPPAVVTASGLARVLPALEPIETTTPLPSVTFESADAPHLTDDRRLVPITSTDELIERAAAVLELPDDADELELALDGIARLCSTPVIDRQLAALAKRASRRRSWAGPPVLSIAAAIVTWHDQTSELPHGFPTAPVRVRTYEDLLLRRAQDIVTGVRRRRARTLLATPTHAGGWIDPVVLIDRVGAEPGPIADDVFDLGQARLRVAPVQQALERSWSSTDPLVGEIEGWVQAGRSEAGPRFELTFEDRSHQVDGVIYHDAGARSQKVGGGPITPPRFVPPLSSITDHELGRAAEDASLSAWLASVWPAHREPLYAAAATNLGTYIRWTVAHGRSRALEPLLDPDEPLGTMAMAAVVLALSAKETSERNFAVDVMIAAIGDGRVGASALGAQLRQCLDAPYLVVPKRWASSLSVVAEASPLHADVVRVALDRCVGGASPVAVGDLLPLLDLLNTLCLEAGVGVSDHAREKLGAITGSSKTAKLARALVAIDGHDDRQRRTASRQLLVAAIARADRWRDADDRRV